MDIKWNEQGLVPVVTQDVKSGEVLMLAWMNEHALKTTLETGDATYFSRSRQSLWRKGETSGQTQKVASVQLDCDRDAILMLVHQTGVACHTGRRGCFYRGLSVEGEKTLTQPQVDSKALYS